MIIIDRFSSWLYLWLISGSNSYNENETIAKFEIMDGAPVRGKHYLYLMLLRGNYFVKKCDVITSDVLRCAILNLHFYINFYSAHITYNL